MALLMSGFPGPFASDAQVARSMPTAKRFGS
jgi:hypothetical protein